MSKSRKKLSNKTIGIIGVGTIGGTLVETLIRNEVVHPDQLLGSTSKKESARKVSEEYNIKAFPDNKKVVINSDIIILSVEPQIIHQVLQETSNAFHQNQLLISVAAGITTKYIETKINGEIPVVRAMPNTAITVNSGATVIVAGTYADDSDIALAKEIFKPVGIIEEVHNENLMDPITGFSGSGPAYGYLIIEALIEAGVRVGLPRDQATKLAAQSLLGAAKMVLATKEHPAKLKDMVTTPAGVTVDGVMKLEEGGLRVAFFKAIEEASNKSRQLKRDEE